MRRFAPCLLALAMLAGCGSSETAADALTERCVDRLLESAEVDEASKEQARSYARRTYCARFEANGWVYADGALAIEAYLWLDRGGVCATGSEGQPTRTVPCEEVDAADPPKLQCALLRHVRRSEVRNYVARVDRRRLECDDGTPLASLGVP